MDETILKKLEQRVDRRSFLRGSGLAAAAIASVTVFPSLSFGQNQDTARPQETKKDDPAAGSDQAKADPDQKKEDKKEETKDGKAKDGKTDEKKEAPDPFKETRKDEQGRDYRLCPQCGYNMYKQDRTWTCENCGFSYTE